MAGFVTAPSPECGRNGRWGPELAGNEATRSAHRSRNHHRLPTLRLCCRRCGAGLRLFAPAEAMSAPREQETNESEGHGYPSAGSEAGGLVGERDRDQQAGPEYSQHKCDQQRLPLVTEEEPPRRGRRRSGSGTSSASDYSGNVWSIGGCGVRGGGMAFHSLGARSAAAKAFCRALGVLWLLRWSRQA